MLEEDLRKVLQFCPKTMKIGIQNLIAQKFVKMRRSDELGGRGRKLDTMRVDYKSIAGIVSHNLDKIISKIEQLERGFYPREYLSFKCIGCPKNFHEFQAAEIFDNTRKLFICPFCRASVIEHSVDEKPKLSMGSFNDQIEPISNILKKLAQKPSEFQQEAYSYDVKVILVKDQEDEEPMDTGIRKEIPPWFY